ncbi:hypothetical protein M8494_31105 [Serratia ureilytica]
MTGMPTLFRRRSDALVKIIKRPMRWCGFGDAGAESNGSGGDPRFDQRFRARLGLHLAAPGVNATTGLRRRKARWR